MRRLIVTADDVGLHSAMTAAAVEAHEHGVVTACSIVANGAAFEHAAERLRDCPTLAAGVHLTLVAERPLAHHVPSLITPAGLFHESYVSFVPRYYAGRISMDEVDRELRLQIERVLGAGLEIAHLNGHQHVHLLPRVFDVVEHLAEEYRVPYVRIVDEPRRGRGTRDAAIAALSMIGRHARERSRVSTNTRTLGVTISGQVGGADDFIALLDDVDEMTELVTHPGRNDEELGQVYAWGYHWESELAALCNPRLRAAIEERGIELVRPGG